MPEAGRNARWREWVLGAAFVAIAFFASVMAMGWRGDIFLAPSPRPRTLSSEFFSCGGFIRMQSQAEMKIRAGHIYGVLLANVILWTAVVLVSGNTRLGGAAVVALISIGSLLRSR